MNAPNPPEYTAIPLPPPDRQPSTSLPLASGPSEPEAPVESSFSAAPPAVGQPDGESPVKAPKPKSRKRRVRQWLRAHPFILVAMVVLLVVGLTVGGFGLKILGEYYDEAKTYNLASMDAVEAGAQALDRSGSPIGRISLQDRRIVSLGQVPDYLLHALVATEDSRFYEHGGYDLFGIARAAVANFKAGRIVQGGSTITQQLARHAFSLGGRTYDRKLRELFLAQRIEEAYSKDEILELYLNRVYFGCGYWGVGAAARGYFGKDVADLTVPEAAMLCAIIKSPNNLAPFIDPEGAVKVRNRTLANMARNGFIEEEKLESYQAAPSGELEEEEREDRPNYLLTKLRSETLEILGRRRTLDGLVIHTSVDLSLQGTLADAIERGVERIEARKDYEHETLAEFRRRLEEDGDTQPNYLQAAAVVIENATGQIVGAVGGRDYRDSQFNRVWDGRSSAGSAFFPFVYAAAFEGGKFTPVSEVVDAAMDNRKVMIGGTEGVLGEWAAEDPEVAYRGKLTAGYGLVASKNGMTLRIGNEVGLSSVVELARSAGIETELRDFPSTFLGASAVNLLQMTHAYTVFPNLGWRTKEPRLIWKITDEEGRVVYEESQRELSKHWVTSDLTAARINQLLNATFTQGTGKDYQNMVGRLKGAVAGKTGTAYGYTDNWFVGYNGRFTWGVWIGFDRSEPIYPGAFSKDTALPIWLSIASTLDSPGDFPMPENWMRESTCLVSGHTATDRCRNAGPESLVVDLPVQPELARGPDQEEAGAGQTDICLVHRDVPVPAGLSASEVEVAQSMYRNVPLIEAKRPVLTGDDPYGTLLRAPEPENSERP